MFDYEWLGRDAHSSTQSYLCPYCNQLVAGIKEKPESVKLAYRANGLDNLSAFSRIRADN